MLGREMQKIVIGCIRLQILHKLCVKANGRDKRVLNKSTVQRKRWPREQARLQVVIYACTAMLTGVARPVF